MSFESRVCLRCEGSGTQTDTWGDKETRKCYNCSGKTMFFQPDFEQIMKDIKGRKGLRTSRPDRSLGARSYYVWRLARFHGGLDVTTPVIADMELGRDPFRPELDLFVDVVAKHVFGTDMAGANCWAKALGYR